LICRRGKERLKELTADSGLRRRGDDVAEADRPCRAAQLNEAEVPCRRRHRAPLLTLNAHFEGALPLARCGRAVPAWPAPDLRSGQMRDAGLDEGAHATPNSQLIEKYHAAGLADGKRPGCTASAEPERPRRPGRGSKLARLVLCGRSRGRS